MRKIEYLSPSGISLFKKDREEFYMRYLSEYKAPRMPQTQAMSIGSAFDAFVKNFLHEGLFGKGNDPKYDLKTLFEAQVEAQNRDWAWVHGKHAFEVYKYTGALADLFLELQSSAGTPKFEIEVKGVVNGFKEGITRRIKEGDPGITLLGKPDVFYINRNGMFVLLDFKVNGWVSKYPPSPMKGYVRLRQATARGHMGPHKDCIPTTWNGTTINCFHYLEDLNKDWATQLTIYAWLCGVEVGQDFIVAIDQIVAKAGANQFPDVRIAEHRLRVKNDFQWATFADIQEVWEAATSGHFFTEMSLEDSCARCDLLEARAMDLKNPATEEDAIFNEMTRPKF